MMVAARGHNSAKRYVKTGSFGRLNGRAVAPGSEVPERCFLRRRLVWGAIALALILPGLWALWW